MEGVTGEDLDGFFRQWLFSAGQPEIRWDWDYRKGKVRISIVQLQSDLFSFPLEIGLVRDGKLEIAQIQISQASERFEIPVSSKPDRVVLDPEVWLLFEEKM